MKMDRAACFSLQDCDRNHVWAWAPAWSPLVAEDLCLGKNTGDSSIVTDERVWNEHEPPGFPPGLVSLWRYAIHWIQMFRFVSIVDGLVLTLAFLLSFHFIAFVNNHASTYH
jgi:hypothetical protein